MASDDVLDIRGIDAVLNRFKARRLSRSKTEIRATEWEVDRPTLLRPESLRSMLLRFKMIAEQLGPEVATVFRTPVQGRLLGVEQIRLRAHLDRLDGRTHLFIVEAPEIKLPAILSVDMGSATSMVDRLVGGRGESMELDRDFTRIEQRVIGDVVVPFTMTVQSVLAAVAPLRLEWKKYYGSPEQLRPLPPTEIFLVASFEVVVTGIAPWTLKFALPLAELVPSIDLATALPIAPAPEKKDRRDNLQKVMTQVHVDVAVEVGQAQVPLEDVLELEVGDVVLLDRRVQGSMDFLLENRSKYRGRLGRVGASLGFKIAEILESPADAAPFRSTDSQRKLER